jgi:outer membrane autotransporter protein
MDTFHERMGEERPGLVANDAKLADKSSPYKDKVNLGWVRVIHPEGRIGDKDKGIYGNGPRLDYQADVIQAGIDLYRARDSKGSVDHAGIHAAAGRMTADVANWDGTRAGHNILDAQTLGAYWTHFWKDGSYVDTVAQYSWTQASASSTAGENLSTHGGIWGASVEAGKPYRLNHSGNTVLEPQAQLIYQHGSLNNAQDSAAQVHFGDIESLNARLGARLAYTWDKTGDASQGKQATLWVQPSLRYEFRGNPQTAFSSATGYIPFAENMKGVSAEIAAGVDVPISKAASIYANGLYGHGLSNQARDNSGWAIKAGLRVVW